MCHGSQFSGRKSNPVTLSASRYKARALTIELQRSANDKKKVFYNDRKGLYSATRSWMQESTSRTSCALPFTVGSVGKRRNW